MAVVALCMGLAGAQAPPAVPPSWVRWERCDRAWDLDGDGDFERLWLCDGRLRLEDAEAAFDSEGLWLASAVTVGDIDADGALEVVALAWREGRFGTYQPFWLEEDEGLFEHLYVFEWRDGQLRPQWMSSGLDLEVASLALRDDGAVLLGLTDGTEQPFGWRQWGFEALEAGERLRSTEGRAELWFAGDAIPHDPVIHAVRTQDPGLLANVAALTQGADLCVANLETPLAGWRDGGVLRFSADAAFAAVLHDAGFDALCLANNHMADAGEEGLERTLAALSQEGLQPLGADEPFQVVQAGDLRLGLVNAGYGLNGGGDAACSTRLNLLDLEGEQLAAAVIAAGEQADLVVCLLHAGQEYAAAPDEAVRRWAERAIDAGASVVAVSHPHVVQEATWVTTASGARGLVCWSLGNLVAYQPDPRTALGCLLHLTVERADSGEARVAAAELVPTVAHGEPGRLAVRLLEDYDAQEAQAHGLNAAQPDSLSLEGLRAQWRSVLGVAGS